MGSTSFFKFHDKRSADTLKITVVTAIFTIFASVSAVAFQSYFTTRTTLDNELRAQRREIYNKYQTNYETYFYAVKDFKDCLLDAAKEANIDTTKTENQNALIATGMTQCNGSGSRLATARYDYQGSVNDMHQIGSKDAIDLVKLLAGFVPGAVASESNDNPFGLPNMANILKFDPNRKHDTTYELFLDQTCRDVRPTDKGVCEEFATGKE